MSLKVLSRKILKSADGRLNYVNLLNNHRLIYIIYITPNYEKCQNRENIYSPELLPSLKVLVFQTKTRHIITVIFMPLFVAILVVYIFDLDIC